MGDVPVDDFKSAFGVNRLLAKSKAKAESMTGTTTNKEHRTKSLKMIPFDECDSHPHMGRQALAVTISGPLREFCGRIGRSAVDRDTPESLHGETRNGGLFVAETGVRSYVLPVSVWTMGARMCPLSFLSVVRP